MNKRIPTLEEYSSNNQNESANTIEKVIRILGPRGKAKEADIRKFIQDNAFDDDFIADIYGYYGIEPIDESTNSPVDAIYDIIVKHCTSLEGSSDYDNATSAAKEIFARINEFKK